MANFCGFLMVFVGVMMLGSLVGFILSKVLKVTGLSFFDRLLGAAFGIMRGVLIAAALVMAMLAFAPGAGRKPDAVAHSRLAPLRDRRRAGLCGGRAAGDEGRVSQKLRAGQDRIGKTR